MRWIAVSALLLTACAPPPAMSDAPKGKCAAVKLDDLIGKPATVALANEARERAGATTVRAIGHGQTVTMEYRADRLTIHLDKDGRVERFICG